MDEYYTARALYTPPTMAWRIMGEEPAPHIASCLWKWAQGRSESRALSERAWADATLFFAGWFEKDGKTFFSGDVVKFADLTLGHEIYPEEKTADAESMRTVRAAKGELCVAVLKGLSDLQERMRNILLRSPGLLAEKPPALFMVHTPRGDSLLQGLHVLGEILGGIPYHGPRYLLSVPEVSLQPEQTATLYELTKNGGLVPTHRILLNGSTAPAAGGLVTGVVTPFRRPVKAPAVRPAREI